MLRRACLLLPFLSVVCCCLAAQAVEGASPQALPTSPAAAQAPQAQTPAPATPEKRAPVTPEMPSRSLRGFTVPADPEHPEPAARDFADSRYHVRFHIPAGWNFERKDGVLSNFGVETRSARPRTEVRGVAEIGFNPWPPTTFAGALFYFSVIPRATAQLCAAQTTTRGMKPLPAVDIDSVHFAHGRDGHGAVCTEARDEAFTAMRGNACLRFDLVINTFCSETSGAMELSADQLQDVQTRLAGILGSVALGK